LILKLLAENRFPAIWLPSQELLEPSLRGTALTSHVLKTEVMGED